jgi:hypothetical protein
MSKLSLFFFLVNNNNNTFRLTFVHNIQLSSFKPVRFIVFEINQNWTFSSLIDKEEQSATNSIISDCSLQINMFDFFLTIK